MAKTSFSIRPLIVSVGPYRYERFQVCGWINQKRVRKICETRDEALGLKNRLEVAALNAKRDPKPVVTRLTPAEVMDSEVAHGRLNGVPLSAAVDWYLTTYRPPVASKMLAEACTAFHESKKPSLSLVVQQCYKRTLRSLCAAFPGKEVSAVGPAAVEGFMKAQNASLKRWNNLRGELHCFFEFCRADARRWCEHNPAKPLAKYKIPRGVPRIETAARIAELMAYVETYAGGPRLQAKPGCLVPYFALTTFSGKLRWQKRGKSSFYLHLPACLCMKSGQRVGGTKFRLLRNLQRITTLMHISSWSGFDGSSPFLSTIPVDGINPVKTARGPW